MKNDMNVKMQVLKKKIDMESGRLVQEKETCGM